MKTPLVVSIAFTAGVLRAADPVLPDFNSRIPATPPLSLGELAKSPTTKPLQFQTALPHYSALNRIESRGARVSRSPGGMPILAPDPAIDYKMTVKAPDPSIDFRMIVKPTEIGSRK